MINQNKPTQGTPQTELDIGGGFNLLIGDTYRLIVGAVNALGGFTNATKVSIGETWDGIVTTWATETQTWLEASQLITNVSVTDNIWAQRTLPWGHPTPWLLTGSGITNVNKP